ncbi:MAG: hypothetical protein JW885_03710 [Deltaproteobacteria bacterium]|nr:hypothetical protein [Candidatus Zymogenaceae bacterium]
MSLNLITEDRLLTTLRRHFGLPSVDLKDMQIPDAIINLINPELARQHRTIPFMTHTISNETYLMVASSDPMDLVARQAITTFSGLAVQTFLAKESQIVSSIKKYYGVDIGFLGSRALSGDTKKKTILPVSLSDMEKSAQAFSEEEMEKYYRTMLEDTTALLSESEEVDNFNDVNFDALADELTLLEEVIEEYSGASHEELYLPIKDEEVMEAVLTELDNVFGVPPEQVQKNTRLMGAFTRLFKQFISHNYISVDDLKSDLEEGGS